MRLARELRPDVVLMDIQMPRLDGWMPRARSSKPAQRGAPSSAGQAFDPRGRPSIRCTVHSYFLCYSLRFGDPEKCFTILVRDWKR